MNKKLITKIALLLFLIAGVIFGLVLVKQNQNISEKAAPATNLSFTPLSLNIVRGQGFQIKPNISSGENVVIGVDIEILFDPSVVQIDQVSPTNMLSRFMVVRNEIDNVSGKVRFIAYIIDKSLAITGKTEILLINGRVLNTARAGSTNISYSSLSNIAASSESQNALINKSEATVTVIIPTPTPTKSPTPTPTPTKSPSPTPEISKVGDVNNDGHVNLIDIGLVIDVYRETPVLDTRADINKNGTVDIIDIGIIIDNYEFY